MLRDISSSAFEAPLGVMLNVLGTTLTTRSRQGRDAELFTDARDAQLHEGQPHVAEPEAPARIRLIACLPLPG